MKRLGIFLSTFASIALLATQSAFAARIYDFLPVPIVAKGQAGSNNGWKVFEVRVPPGNRSESINWTSTTWVQLEAEGVTCRLSFGNQYHMQGGNYVTIGVRGHEVVCTLCGSSHEIMAQRAVPGWAEWKPTRTGC